jgi:hypothetical protein
MDATLSTSKQSVTSPIMRKLRVFAMDPGLTARFDTAIINEMSLAIPWEDLEPGPVGEYVEVIDIDEKGTQLHEPVDLNDLDLLAQDGLTPSDGNPQFRQQMVYAVAMRTIRNFERAVGRPVHWLLRKDNAEGKNSNKLLYRPRLKLHPHFMADQNAYFDGEALKFGYFESSQESPFAGALTFTCLAQDVIAHELTHAILAGMGFWGRVTEVSGSGETASELDILAFHEAFADLIPLFQRFWKSDVLAAQIASVRGKLDEHSPLGAVGLQMSQAMGLGPDGLRNALGKTVDGQWRPRQPDPKLYYTVKEPHERGDILVGAIFEAFKKVFESRVSDLRRIATKGSGLLPEGAIHPDLVNRFTDEAAKSARHLLDMCIRALDYLPPVNITFGDYIRAIITADHDLYPIDDRRYRVAFVDAFRSYGIVPPEVRTLSVETLLWPNPESEQESVVLAGFVRTLSHEQKHWTLPRDRELLWKTLESWKSKLTKFLRQNASALPTNWGGIDFAKPFEVISLLPRERAGLSGRLSSQWVIKITQEARHRYRVKKRRDGGNDLPLLGLTLLVDADTGHLRYRIAKPLARNRNARLNLGQAAGNSTRILPRERRLRVFAFDPSLGVQLETAGINEISLAVPWERDRTGREMLQPGPVGEYLEIIDRDPASECFYEPIDLNHPHLLAQDGLCPSESNPQFHQQMVYAVAMRTIQCFEQALGRLILWAPQSIPGRRKEHGPGQFVQRLRMYPHGLREANAYYSPAKIAVLFGYFPAPVASDAVRTARVNVFTCLSHDIVAHEVTHALVDGMHRRFAEASNPDVLAFHEAFADLVALFLHFSLPGVLRHQIAMTRGDLASQNRLGEVAQQFGQALGKRGALRSALGEIDETTGRWEPRRANPEDYQRLREPHERGAILVAAVFDAFLTIYKAQIADLLRIASEGTGVLPEGQLHPDLVNRLADEAARAARKILEMCIRGLDYCPPVDVTFGDYLRAIITADFEFDPINGEHRRIAIAEAFRRHGIIPQGIRTLSVDGLLWRPTSAISDENEDVLLSIFGKWAANIDLWNLSNDRRQLFEQMGKQRAGLHKYLRNKFTKDGVSLSGINPALKLEVHSIRPTLRVDWEGRPSFQWIVELTQRIPQYISSGAQHEERGQPDYYVRGGCTLVVDAATGKIRYTIRKTLDEARIKQQRRYILEQANENLAATYFGKVALEENEPFAILHRF